MESDHGYIKRCHTISHSRGRPATSKKTCSSDTGFCRHHQPVRKTKRSGSLPGVAGTFEILRHGAESLKDYENDISVAKSDLENALQREKKAIEEYEKECEKQNQTNAGRHRRLSGRLAGLRKWINLKMETGKNDRKTKDDVKKAAKAMSKAEEMVNQMEETMIMEEENLNQRANALRRKSVDAFKMMNDIKRLRNETNEGFEEGFEEKDEEEQENEDSMEAADVHHDLTRRLEQLEMTDL